MLTVKQNVMRFKDENGNMQDCGMLLGASSGSGNGGNSGSGNYILKLSLDELVRDNDNIYVTTPLPKEFFEAVKIGCGINLVIPGEFFDDEFAGVFATLSSLIAFDFSNVEGNVSIPIAASFFAAPMMDVSTILFTNGNPVD